jgi:glycosyltransferase involved in cell wall biosynthesis
MGARVKIGIDAHGVGGHSLGPGNETYFQGLISALLEIDAANEYHVFVNHPEAMADTVRGHDNARLVSLYPHSQWLQRPISVPLYARRQALDLVHFPFVRPPLTGAKTVITVHDVNFEVFPQDFTRIERWRMKLLVPGSCRKADKIFVVSEYGKNQLHEVYGVSLDKIVVTYNAPDHVSRRTSEDRQPPERKLDLPKPYVLYVGIIQPKKNLPRLVQAFDRLKSRTDLPHHLVIAGKWGWNNADLEKTLASMTHRDQVAIPGYLSRREFESAMSGASLFAFPSLYESFGIPPMEAQSFGIPAVVSDTTCFPEIYGDSVAYCDPYSVESIAAALERVLGDEVLRADLVRRGRERTRLFTWKKTAAIALDAYRSLVEERGDEPRGIGAGG